MISKKELTEEQRRLLVHQTENCRAYGKLQGTRGMKGPDIADIEARHNAKRAVNRPIK